MPLGLYKTVKMIIKQNTTHILELEDDEYLMNYKTAPEGLSLLDVSVHDVGYYIRQVSILNNDGRFEHMIILLIGKKQEAKLEIEPPDRDK